MTDINYYYDNGEPIPDGKLDSGSGIPDFVSAKEINLKNLIIYKNC